MALETLVWQTGGGEEGVLGTICHNMGHCVPDLAAAEHSSKTHG